MSFPSNLKGWSIRDRFISHYYFVILVAMPICLTVACVLANSAVRLVAAYLFFVGLTLFSLVDGL